MIRVFRKINLIKDWFYFRSPWMHRCNTLGHVYKKYLDKNLANYLNKKKRSDCIYVLSVCVDEFQTGDYAFNGGVKILHQWAHALSEMGEIAYVMTYNGTCKPWLNKPAKTISYQELKELKDSGKRITFISSWLIAKIFFDLADGVFFHDCEMALTCGTSYKKSPTGTHYNLLKKYIKSGKIIGISTHSRTQQSWYIEKFGITPNLIPIWMDPLIWKDDQSKRVAGRIGFMKESPSSLKEIENLKEILMLESLDLEWVEVCGNEAECVSILQSCDLFLGLNRGKHNLWGEGSPLPQLEALSAGCVLIAYDVKGNREYLIPNVNGFIIDDLSLNAMAERIKILIQDPILKERMRKAGLQISQMGYTPQARYHLLANLLKI